MATWSENPDEKLAPIGGVIGAVVGLILGFREGGIPGALAGGFFGGIGGVLAGLAALYVIVGLLLAGGIAALFWMASRLFG